MLPCTLGTCSTGSQRASCANNVRGTARPTRRNANEVSRALGGVLTFGSNDSRTGSSVPGRRGASTRSWMIACFLTLFVVFLSCGGDSTPATGSGQGQASSSSGSGGADAGPPTSCDLGGLCGDSQTGCIACALEYFCL